MKTFKKFTCAECGGTVDLAPPKGRTIEYMRGYDVPIPEEFLIPTCSRCDEIYIVGELEETLYPILEKQCLRMQAEHYRELVEILIRRHGVKQQDIVRACAVTPAYMSHVLNGKRAASTTLTRLLEAFVVCESEFGRHLERRHWSKLMTIVHSYKASEFRELKWGKAQTPQSTPQWTVKTQTANRPLTSRGVAA